MIISFFKFLLKKTLETPANVELTPLEPPSKKTVLEETHHLDFLTYINKPVIAINNNWGDPVIGYGLKIQFINLNRTPALVIKDYITGTEHIAFGKVFLYNPQRFNAIIKLTPIERWSLVYSDDNKKQELIIKHLSSDADNIVKKLKQNGFFKRLKDEVAISGGSIKDLLLSGLLIKIPDKIIISFLPDKTTKCDAYLFSKGAVKSFVELNPSFTVSTYFNNALQKEEPDRVIVFFLVDDLIAQAQVLSVLTGNIEEHHSLTRREMLRHWDTSEYEWRNRYKKDNTHAFPKIEWGEIKVMVSL